MKSYSIQQTTLEYVYLKVAESAAKEEGKAGAHAVEEDIEASSFSKNRRSCLCCRHTIALLQKRLKIYQRSYKVVFIEFIVPVLLIAFGFGFSKINFYFDSGEKLLEPQLFD